VSEIRKTITIYFVTSDDKSTKRLVLPVAYFKLTAFFMAVVVLAFMAGFIDYFGLLAQSLENKKLKIENLNLKKQFQVVEGKLDGLQSALDRVTNISNKLKLITDTKLQDRPEKLNFSANQIAQNLQDEAKDTVNDKIKNHRMSLSELEKSDPVVQSEAALNPMKGELASEKSTSNYATLVIRIDDAIKDSNLKEQSVIELWELLSDRQSLLAATPSIRPVRGSVGSRFGFRVDPFNGKQRMHAGLDFVVSPGTPVRAPADGIVSFAGWDEQYGKLVSIDHGFGVLTRYGHNSQLYVQVGQKVSKYDVISASGSTGRSTGPHVHYEVRVNSIPVDPSNYILDDE
jgi:murein DD-endopeptidase MepM/ murein hydrolase activator NlpD